MIRTEVAQKEIKKHVDKKKAKACLAATKRLPKKLRGIALLVLHKDEKGKSISYWDRDQYYRQGSIALGALTVSERARIIRIFTPSLVKEVERAYQFSKTLPISGDYGESMVFRSRSDSADSLEHACFWFVRFLGDANIIDEKTLTPEWIATWAAHFDYSVGLDVDYASTLLASEISHGGKTGDAVFELLRQSATREHEVAAMGQHVPDTLLMASNPEGWKLIEGMLLAAQRQEGLRQSILEATVNAHPDAFIRILKVVKDNRLARFSAVAHAFNQWFGFGWDSASVSVINKILDRLLLFAEKGVPAKVWNGDDGEAVYLGLWAVGMREVTDAIAKSKELLASKTPEVRFAAVHYLGNLSAGGALAARVGALSDEDERIRAIVIESMRFASFDDSAEQIELDAAFESLEAMLPTVTSKARKLKPILWPWIAPKIDRSDVAGALLQCIGDFPPTRLIPNLKLLDSYSRSRAIGKLVEQKKWDDLSRSTIIAAIGDSTADVRDVAIKPFKRKRFRGDEFLVVERFLKRKGNELRTSIVSLLLRHKDASVLESAGRLLDSRSGPQRMAGLELLRQMSDADRSRQKCIDMVTQWQSEKGRLTRDENIQVTAVLESSKEPITLDNALGLCDPQARPPAVAPKKISVKYVTPAAIQLLKEIDAFIHLHRKEEIEVESWRGDRDTVKIGSDPWLPSPERRKPRKEQFKRLPLGELWFEWLASRPSSTRDDDGLEIFRASKIQPFCDSYDWRSCQSWAGRNVEQKKVLRTVLGTDQRIKLKYESVVSGLIQWFLFMQPPKKLDEYLLDACENLMAIIPPGLIAGMKKRKKNRWGDSKDWRNDDAEFLDGWIDPLKGLEKLNRAQKKRRYQLLRWYEQPIPEAKRNRMPFPILVEGYEAKVATMDDVADHILGPSGIGWSDFDAFRQLTSRRLSDDNEAILNKHPEIADLVEQCRERIVELEIQRGERETAATEPAGQMGSVFGTDVLIRLLAGLGKTGFKTNRSWRSSSTSKAQSLTRLVEVCYPGPDESPEDFASKMKAAVADGRVREELILPLAFQSPQWTLYVEAYLGWDGFSEGLYWFLAHMRYVWGGFNAAAVGTEHDVDDDDFDDDFDEDDEAILGRERLSPWDRLVLQRTSLTDAERHEGAIDVQWFQRTRASLSDARWDAMSEAARYASTPAQAKRARYIADVLTGRADRAELIEKLQKRKLKENVRLLGLLPIANGKAGKKDLLERYEILQEYRRYANTLSGLTKPEAMRACDIGFENLSRTAGYPDPLRLEWSLEAESTKDLKSGVLEVSKDDVTVRMELDAKCMPVVTIRRGNKPLKSIPRSHKKDADMIAIRERAKEVKRKASRSRRSLETAMCRRDPFVGKELKQLATHHLLWPLLSRLVLVGEGIMGYPDKGGRALRDHAGKLEPVKADETLRIAHPYDLFKAKDWSKWQQECFAAERIQPFKQVFRELYVLTSQEKKDKTKSSRYAGQQVNPKQAFALWGSRGWHTRDEIWKAFPAEGITVNVGFEWAPGSPSEIEGLTVDTISFQKRDSYDVVALKDVDPITYSELMRDVDLVVSVAHRGEVDPEASASTTEMRSSLIKQTCQLLGRKNVSVKKNHATIRGELGEYSVHLGSGLVHRLPGGHVCIVPVHAQHRGRLFLPFADDDPKTAEIVSKVLLLSRDDEIDDPTILEQIRAAAT